MEGYVDKEIIDRWEWPRGSIGEGDTGKRYSQYHSRDAILSRSRSMPWLLGIEMI